MIDVQSMKILVSSNTSMSSVINLPMTLTLLGSFQEPSSGEQLPSLTVENKNQFKILHKNVFACSYRFNFIQINKNLLQVPI